MGCNLPYPKFGVQDHRLFHCWIMCPWLPPHLLYTINSDPLAISTQPCRWVPLTPFKPTTSLYPTDSQTPHWDGGYIRLKHHLPVTQLVFRQGSGQGQTNVTMGPLRCAGTSKSLKCKLMNPKEGCREVLSVHPKITDSFQ